MLTMTDMFCGAGGSSTGALDVPGIEIKVATNHWDLAIETHNTNHEDADHVLADVSQIDPRYFPKSDILWASPECTNHSQAKGVKRTRQVESLFDQPDQAAERSRATMWDVPRFAEHHKYKIIITENVVDAAKWVMWSAWLHAMDSLGYDHHVVYMNSMHAQTFGAPAPQSRDRMYVVFWLKGNKRPDFDKLRPRAYCSTCDEVITAMQVFKKTPSWGRYRTQYVWRCPNTACRNAVVEPGWLPASSVIDWSIPAQRIGDRDKPLSVKTMRRIEAGLRKYIEPMLVNNVSGADASRSTPLTSPAPTFVSGGLHASLLVPVEGRNGKEARPAAEALRTQTTRNETALLVPAGGTWHDTAHPSTDPLRTLTTREAHGVVLPALQLEAAGNTYDAADPKHRAYGKDDGYYRIWSADEPLKTLHTTASKGVVIPLRNNNTPKPDLAPFDTFAASGTHHGVLQSESVNIDDCLFRMLVPTEIMLGMAFPSEYVLLGNKRQQVRMAGNAVTPPMARDLLGICVESMVGLAA